MIVTKVDSIEIEQFRELIQSNAFARIQSRIQQEMNRNQDLCVRGDTELEIRRAQGAVAALRSAIMIPMRIYEEMKKG